MKNTTPLVSVLMTAYNRENFIGEAIESILQCTYKNFELVIVDDCSADRTVEIIQKFALIDNRIRFYQNEKNLGDYPNRNKAATYANGEYIAYLDSDDRMLPEGLEKCVHAMQLFPGAGIGMYWLYSKGESFSLSSEEAIRQHFFKQQLLIIGPGGTLLRRSFFEKLKGYPQKYGPANDMYFNLKAACNSELVLFPFEFIYYRQHDSQENKNQYSYLYNNYLYLKDALNELPLPLSAKEKEWISDKNKRRFFVNLFKFFYRTRDLRKIAKALRITSFGINDFIRAVFQ